jgi:hypothetical protein
MSPCGVVNCKVLGPQGPLLTNRMTQLVTYGSVGGVGRKPGLYPALDAAMSFSLHIGGHWRGASYVQRWPFWACMKRRSLCLFAVTAFQCLCGAGVCGICDNQQQREIHQAGSGSARMSLALGQWNLQARRLKRIAGRRPARTCARIQSAEYCRRWASSSIVSKRSAHISSYRIGSVFWGIRAIWPK